MESEQLYGHGDLADLLRDRILSGDLPPGSVLPSDKYLQQTYGLGRETVRAALINLQMEGLVVRRQGQASRVRPLYDKQPLDLAGVVRVDIRLPSPQERSWLGERIEPGVPVWVLTYGDGSVQLKPGDRWYLPTDGGA